MVAIPVGAITGWHVWQHSIAFEWYTITKLPMAEVKLGIGYAYVNTLGSTVLELLYGPTMTCPEVSIENSPSLSWITSRSTEGRDILGQDSPSFGVRIYPKGKVENGVLEPLRELDLIEESTTKIE